MPTIHRILSSVCHMSDIQDCNVSVVEDLYKSREPLPLAAVYFVQVMGRPHERALEMSTVSALPLLSVAHEPQRRPHHQRLSDG